MSTVFRNTAVALGITTIALAWIVQPVLLSGYELLYHWSGSTLDLFVPVFLDILVVWLLLSLFLTLARAPGRRRVAVWGAILLCTISLKSEAILTRFKTPHRLNLLLFLSVASMYLLIVLLWRPSFEERFDRFLTLVSTVFLFAAIGGVFYLGQLTWLAWKTRALNHPVPLHRGTEPRHAPARKPRIIWIVLDELSYQQLYQRRFPGLQLPAFDALARQAAVFTNVIPAGEETEKVLPSLITGIPVDQIRSSAQGQLSVHDPQTRAWQPFVPQDTVFQDALNAGYSTALAGWWNPYCRILPAVLDRCYWSNRTISENGMVPGEPIWWNMVEPLRSVAGPEASTLMEEIFHLPNAASRLHIADYQNIFAVADRMLEDPTEGFVLLHLPIPHPDGIYDRRTGQLTTTPTTYMDNLALADEYLAHVRSILERSGEWNSSTILIMGDHSWRTTFMWMGSPDWTKEEQGASRGQFDPRPGYIVKLANQQTGVQIGLPFRALDTRRLLDALLYQKIQSPDELRAWVQQIAGTATPHTRAQ